MIASLFRLKVCFTEPHVSEEIKQLMKDPDNAFYRAERLFKNDPTSTVALIELKNETLVLKRSNACGFFHGLKRLLSSTRAKRTLVNARRLQAAKIETLVPLAYAEERFACFTRRSYLLCHEINGIRAYDYFHPIRTLSESDWAILKKINQVFLKLAQSNYSHGDLNLTNLILANGNPVLIDLESMKKHSVAWVAKKQARRDKRRFLENWSAWPEHLELGKLFK